MKMCFLNHPGVRKSFKVALLIESIATGISAFILYFHPEHSYFFVAAQFHLPGAIVGFIMIDLLKSVTASFYPLFTIFSITTIFLQIIIITALILAYSKLKKRILPNSFKANKT